MRTADTTRALVLMVGAFVHVLFALPSPSPVADDAYQDPTAAAELAAWSSTTGVEPETLAQGVRTASRAWDTFGRTVRKPFRPFLIATGTGQSWAMFAHPDPTPQRLEIWVLEDEWTCIYRSHDADRQWNHAVLGERRVRGIWDSVGDDGSIPYWNFTRWIGRQAIADHPRATAVRVQLNERTLGAPGEPGTQQVRLRREFQRIVFEDEE